MQFNYKHQYSAGWDSNLTNSAVLWGELGSQYSSQNRDKSFAADSSLVFDFSTWLLE